MSEPLFWTLIVLSVIFNLLSMALHHHNARNRRRRSR